MQENANPILDTLGQVRYKTLLGMKECWQIHWHMCITILQTLKETQTLFVVDSVKLHSTALIFSIFLRGVNVLAYQFLPCISNSQPLSSSLLSECQNIAFLDYL